MYQRVYTISKKDFKKVDTRFSEEISSKSLPKFKAQKYHKRSVYATFGLGGDGGIRTLEDVLASYTISNRAPSTGLGDISV